MQVLADCCHELKQQADDGMKQKIDMAWQEIGALKLDESAL